MHPITIARALLAVGAAVSASVGIGFLVAPEQCAAILEISLPTAMARTDVRATYGGLDLAIGIFLAMCAAREDWVRPGLVAFALTTAGFATGRLTGITMEGGANTLMLFFLALEISTTLLTLYVLRSVSNR